ncbi:MAG: outer membrane lipoprotein-sorting protein [Magnetococcales bacterium]|nr:outer membrane lipoprotein-sorting protein [Magnetococcales bacterium]
MSVQRHTRQHAWVIIVTLGVVLFSTSGLAFTVEMASPSTQVIVPHEFVGPLPFREESNWNGDQIMDEVMKRHEQYPFVFEEQTMILQDKRGNRDVRSLRRYSRVENNGAVKYLLIFDNPPTVRGTALLAIRHADGIREDSVYLPALTGALMSLKGAEDGSHFLGTDFAVADLAPEAPEMFIYTRTKDRTFAKVAYFVVDAHPVNEDGKRVKKEGYRRHFIRQDTFFLSRTDFFDRRGRLIKTRTFHDLKRIDGKMWRGNMVLMDNHKSGSETLIKINRRIFSQDYVPPEMFTAEWLTSNKHVGDSAEERLFPETSPLDPQKSAESRKPDPPGALEEITGK